MFQHSNPRSPKKDQPGADGATARLYLAVLPHLMRWKLGEMNRGGIGPNDTMSALISLVASQLVAEICSVYGPPPAAAAHYKTFNTLLNAIAVEAAGIFTGNSHYQMESVDLVEGAGHA